MSGAAPTGSDFRAFTQGSRAIPKPCSSSRRDQHPTSRPCSQPVSTPFSSGLMAHVSAHLHSPLTRKKQRRVDGDVVSIDLYLGEDERWLLERANQFLLTEITLWWLAGEGGFEGAAPYTVRYEAARYLWSPQIAGSAFCLRCGDPIHYLRAARAGARSAPICATCIRGGSFKWPAHAFAPAERGTWWLRCLAQDCTNPFVGRAQARRCPACRTSRRAIGKRRPLVPMPEGEAWRANPGDVPTP